MRLAIMQPYLWSAWGYYRLFAAADMFIIHDDCQYVKASWVNRNRFTLANGAIDWFTLPLKKMPTETLIKDIQFAEGANEHIIKQMQRFPVFKKLGIGCPAETLNPYDVICDSMLWVLRECDMWDRAKMLASSELNLPKGLKGQDKVIEICKHFHAIEYINLSGGAKLYDKEEFKKWGIDLQFLREVQDKTNILERIAQVGKKQVRKDIYDNL